MMDDSMKELFGALRSHDLSNTTSFEDILGRRRPSSHGKYVALAVATAILALLFWPRHMADEFAAQNITSWRAPTDALLDVPGNQLFSELPALHESVINVGTP